MTDDLFSRRGCVRISREDILRILDLPEGTEVLGVRGQFDPASIEIIVVHPDLPSVPPDAQSPVLAAPTVYVDRMVDDQDVIWHRSTVRWQF